MAENNYENIFITRDAPLVVREESDNRHYGTVYLEDGAYIEIRAGENFTIEELHRFVDGKNAKRLVGASYPTLKQKEKIRDGLGYDIIITSASGSNGVRGENGGYGGGVGERGSHGTCAKEESRGRFILSVNNLGMNAKVISTGGSGGNAGNGGRGGEGWDGASLADPGTVGGNGGNGGSGGHASDAVGNLFVFWQSKEGYELQVESKASMGGHGGKGGLAGANGRYYDGTVKPFHGTDGSDGLDGDSGKVNRVVKFDQGKNPLAGLFEETEGVKMTMEGWEENGGTKSLDFADPLQTQRFLNHFGGEDFLSVNYPEFYKAYLRTVKASERKASDSNVSHETLPDGTISSSFGVTAINAEKPIIKSQHGVSADHASMLEIFNYTCAHDMESRFSVITGEIKNVTDNVLLETYGVTNFGKDFEYKFSTRPLDYLGANGKKMQESSYRTFVTDGALLGAEQASSEAVLVNGLSSIVKKITLTMPKSTANNNPLIYLYNRGAETGETSDKSYGMSAVDYHDKDNSVNTLMGISGSILFNADAGVSAICGYSKKSDTDNRKLMVSGTGAAQFNYTPTEIAGFFTPVASEAEPKNEMTANFTFPDDWKCRLDKNVYDSGAKSVIVNLLFSFYYKIQITDPTSKLTQIFDMPITIKSESTLPPGKVYYEAENSTTVLIPPIKIRWGCFAGDTRIRMANGTGKKICDLKCGDMVETPSGGKPVLEVYYGTEKTLIYLKTSGGCVMAVTKDHPVLTKRGVLRAEHLDQGDEVKMADGSHETLLEVYEVDYEKDQPVYNIEVDGGLIFAEGFLAGEFGTQNDLSRFEESKIFGRYGAIVPNKKDETEFPEDAKAVAEELKKLCSQRFGFPVSIKEAGI